MLAGLKLSYAFPLAAVTLRGLLFLSVCTNLAVRFEARVNLTMCDNTTMSLLTLGGNIGPRLDSRIGLLGFLQPVNYNCMAFRVPRKQG